MLRRFLEDERANILLPFTLLSGTLVVAAGGAIDIARLQDSRVHLQQAVDASALVIANQISNDGTQDTDATRTSKARAAIVANLGTNASMLGTVTTSATGSSVTINASASIPTSFLKLVGLQTLDTSAAATTVWANTSLEIALVLDNTGSMADDNKMTSLKSAATSMIDTISAKASSTYSIKFALVPFSNFVKVGSGYSAATWIDQGASSRSSYYDSYFSSHIDRLATFTALGKTWPGCVETRPSPYDIDDTAPSTSLPDTLFVPSFHPDEPDSGYYYANDYMNDQNSGNDWTRMVNANKYKTPTGLDFSNSTLYSNYQVPKGPQFMCDVQPLQRLTTNYTSLKSQISSMVSVGSTNIPEGIAWGWRVLSPKGPFSDGAAYSTQNNAKIMVVLTDGTNSVNTFSTALGGAYSSWGYPASNRLGTSAGTNLRTGLDAKTRSVCSKVKAAGIQVYTIGLMIDDTSGQQLLSDCATGTTYYYNSPTASQLDAVFADIAKKISKLRIAS